MKILPKTETFYTNFCYSISFTSIFGTQNFCFLHQFLFVYTNFRVKIYGVKKVDLIRTKN